MLVFASHLLTRFGSENQQSGIDWIGKSTPEDKSVDNDAVAGYG